MNQNKTKQSPYIHILAWAIVFGAPLLIFMSDSNMGLKKYTGYFVQMLLYMVVFYANYLYLINKYLMPRRMVLFVTANLLLILACYLIQKGIFEHVIQTLFPPEKKPPHYQKRTSFSQFRFFIDTISYLMLIGLSVAVKVMNQWYHDRDKLAEMKSIQTEAELKNLKSQLNPHFLFNTLNNIYSLVNVDQEKAQEAIHKLSKLLRYTLYDDNQQYVPLDKELEFVNNYIELMKLRLASNVKLTVDIASGKGDEQIAPLIFITIIENAFKHGLGNQQSFISIAIHVKNKQVECTVQNSLFLKEKETDSDDQSGSGIGLENISRRLELLYPDKHKFEITQNDTAFIVNLQIDLLQ